MGSHLTELIKRVRSIPKRLKTEPIFFNKLMNLAEYMHWEKDYNEFEHGKASAILKVYNLDYLLSIETDAEFEREIRKLSSEKGGGARVCIRCGRTLSNPNSIQRGYGEECYSKRQIVDDSKSTADLRKFFDRSDELEM